jgi:hypothetical protein
MESGKLLVRVQTKAEGKLLKVAVDTPLLVLLLQPYGDRSDFRPLK